METPTYQPASSSLPCCSFRNMLSPLLAQSVGEQRPASTKCPQRPRRGLKAEGTGGLRSPPQLHSLPVTQSSSQGHLPEAGEVSEVGKTCVPHGTPNQKPDRAGCSAAKLARLCVSSRQLFSLPLKFSDLRLLTPRFPPHPTHPRQRHTRACCSVCTHFLCPLAKLPGETPLYVFPGSRMLMNVSL